MKKHKCQCQDHREYATMERKRAKWGSLSLRFALWLNAWRWRIAIKQAKEI